MEQDEYQDLVQKYKERVRKEFGEPAKQQVKVTSREYSEFKRELYPTRYTLYEKACNASERLLKIKADKKKAIKLQKSIQTCHLNITPNGVTSFAILAALIIIVFGSLFLFLLPLILGLQPMLFLVIIALIGGLLMIPALQNTPNFMANSWRMKSSNQMVQSIFYMVTFMRHTSNLERAIEFAADHLSPPLSLDFRKILWDVETQRYSSIRDAANAYLEQ